MIIDILVGAVLLISLLISFFRGFIREILTVFGLAGAVFGAIIIGPMLDPILLSMLTDPNAEEAEKLFGVVPMSLVATLIAYGGVFVILMIILSLISHFLSSAAEKIGLGSLDRTLGAIFGLARGVLLLGLLYLPFHYLMDEEQKEAWFGNTATHPYLEWTAMGIDTFIPKSADEETIEEIKLEGQENIERIMKEAQPNRGDDENASSKDEKDQDGYEQDNRKNLNSLIETLNEE